MKQSTKERKLAELLGLTAVVEQVQESRSNVNKYVGIPLETIDSYRHAQGLYYFLQAPKLFTRRTCSHCKEPFLVSRHSVGLCSYPCIKKSLEEMGINWTHDKNDTTFEAFINRVYDGNEPLWVRNLDTLQEALQVIIEASQSTPALT